MLHLSIKRAEELFNVLDEHLISNLVEERVSKSVEHYFKEFKKNEFI